MHLYEFKLRVNSFYDQRSMDKIKEDMTHKEIWNMKKSGIIRWWCLLKCRVESIEIPRNCPETRFRPSSERYLCRDCCRPWWLQRFCVWGLIFHIWSPPGRVGTFCSETQGCSSGCTYHRTHVNMATSLSPFYPYRCSTLGHPRHHR